MNNSAVGYVRVSGQAQTEGHGWERQEETVRAFANHRGVDLLNVYYESHTGTETDRPVFIEMLTDMLASGVKVVIIERLDRLARDLLVQCQLIARLLDSDIELLAADTGENITEATKGDPMRKALIGVQGIFAELDKSMLVRKLRKAREAKRIKGLRCEGKKPYGEHPDHPKEKDILLRMVGMSVNEDMAPTEIAEQLNGEGVYTRKGSLWNPGTVYKILRRTSKKLHAELV